jgi:hypothetical protein
MIKLFSLLYYLGMCVWFLERSITGGRVCVCTATREMDGERVTEGGVAEGSLL